MLDSFDYRVFLSPNETINSKGALLEKQFVCARVREREKQECKLEALRLRLCLFLIDMPKPSMLDRKPNKIDLHSTGATEQMHTAETIVSHRNV